MGSARATNSKPAMDRKTLMQCFKALFATEKSKADKKENRQTKEKAKVKVGETAQKKETKPVQNVNPLASILENFQKLELKDTNEVSQENVDESLNFTVKVIQEPLTLPGPSVNARNNSLSSHDSGFADSKEVENIDKTEKSDKTENLDKADKLHKVDKLDKPDKSDKAVNVDKPVKFDKVVKLDKSDKDDSDKTEEVIAGFQKLELDDKKKKKKWQTVVVPRGPLRNKVSDFASSISPYPGQESDSYTQIHQINKRTLTGGQVIVNQQQIEDNSTEFHLALKQVENRSQVYQTAQESQEYLQVVLEYISEETKTFTRNPQESQAQDQDAFLNNLLEQTLTNFSDQDFNQILNNEYINESIRLNNDEYISDSVNSNYIYPTPPHDSISSRVDSPSFYTPNYDSTLSPALSSSPVYNADYENYQEIPHFEEEKETKRERKNSISSMTMKQFKDMQKEIAYNLSKGECCQLSRKSCKEIFQEHLQKLEESERKNLCFKVAKLVLKTAFGVLHHILLSLSRGSDQEDLQYALFGLVCGRILTQDASLFVGDAGLGVLKSAALRCPHRPLFTRHLVQCVRAALRADPALARDKDAVFHETDALGDTLAAACARAGDACADVLAELVRAEPHQPPLFNTHHTNADGRTALHVACSEHSARAPRLRTVHVLLDHAAADLWKGDVKGGDSALHLAVNSATCDLQLVLLLFKHVDRKLWKNLAHCPNMSSVTPIEYARTATKTATRQNYPQEVLDFLKKCR